MMLYNRQDATASPKTLSKTICRRCKGDEWTVDDEIRWERRHSEGVVYCPELEVNGITTIHKVPPWCRYAAEQVVSQC